MAGSGTVTNTEIIYPSVQKVKLEWTSASDGRADASSDYYYNGKIIQVTTVPDGTDAPTDNYDVYVKDGDGVDLLQGNGMNRDTANTEHIAGASLGAVCESKLTLLVQNAGDTKKGTVYVYLR